MDNGAIEIRSQRHAVGVGRLVGALAIALVSWPVILEWASLMEAWPDRGAPPVPPAREIFVYLATAILLVKAIALGIGGLRDVLHTQLAPDLPRGFVRGAKKRGDLFAAITTGRNLHLETFSESSLSVLLAKIILGNRFLLASRTAKARTLALVRQFLLAAGFVFVLLAAPRLLPLGLARPLLLQGGQVLAVVVAVLGSVSLIPVLVALPFVEPRSGSASASRRHSNVPGHFAGFTREVIDRIRELVPGHAPHRVEDQGVAEGSSGGDNAGSYRGAALVETPPSSVPAATFGLPVLAIALLGAGLYAVATLLVAGRFDGAIGALGGWIDTRDHQHAQAVRLILAALWCAATYSAAGRFLGVADAVANVYFWRSKVFAVSVSGSYTRQRVGFNGQNLYGESQVVSSELTLDAWAAEVTSRSEGIDGEREIASFEAGPEIAALVDRIDVFARRAQIGAALPPIDVRDPGLALTFEADAAVGVFRQAALESGRPDPLRLAAPEPPPLLPAAGAGDLEELELRDLVGYCARGVDPPHLLRAVKKRYPSWKLDTATIDLLESEGVYETVIQFLRSMDSLSPRAAG